MHSILIADDHPLFRDAIASVLDKYFSQISTSISEDLESTIAMLEKSPDLDLILLDLNMPGMDGLNGIIKLRNAFPKIPVVIVTAEEDKSVVLQALTYGAVGFITKSSDSEQMVEALKQILDGQVYLPPDVIRSSPPSRNPKKSPVEIDPKLIDSLSRRQLLVYERMAKGESNKQIAHELCIAETTVKSHVSAILRKLNVHNRVQAVLCASSIDFNLYLRH